MISVIDFIHFLDAIELDSRRKGDKCKAAIVEGCPKITTLSLEANAKYHYKAQAQAQADIMDMLEYEEVYGPDKKANSGADFLLYWRRNKPRGGFFVDNTAPSSAQELGLEDSDFEFSNR